MISPKMEKEGTLKKLNEEISQKFFEISSEQQRTRNEKREQLNNLNKHKQAIDLIK